MSTALVTFPEVSASTLETVLLHGDISRLSSSGRIEYMQAVCKSLGLNPLTKPFEFLAFQGKMVMYARRDCTEQLRKIHGVSVTIASREVVEDCYVVTARAQDATGRHDESIGAVSIAGLKGEARSNAMMKAETKAKRRVTLSVCGLGILDESEADSIPGARVPEYTPPPAKEEAKAGGPKDGQAPKTVPSAAPSTNGTAPSSAAASQVPTANAHTEIHEGGKGYVPANKILVKRDDVMVTPSMAGAINELRMACLDEQTFRLTWLGAYKTHESVKCIAVHELTAAQADNLYRRMTAHAQRQGQRLERMGVEGSANLAAVVGKSGDGTTPRTASKESIDDLFQEVFEKDEEEATWIHGIFGKELRRELDKNESETALQLLIAMKMGEDHYDNALDKARALGRIR